MLKRGARWPARNVQLLARAMVITQIVMDCNLDARALAQKACDPEMHNAAQAARSSPGPTVLVGIWHNGREMYGLRSGMRPKLSVPCALLRPGLAREGEGQ